MCTAVPASFCSILHNFHPRTSGFGFGIFPHCLEHMLTHFFDTLPIKSLANDWMPSLLIADFCFVRKMFESKWQRRLGINICHCFCQSFWGCIRSSESCVIPILTKYRDWTLFSFASFGLDECDLPLVLVGFIGHWRAVVVCFTFFFHLIDLNCRDNLLE